MSAEQLQHGSTSGLHDPQNPYLYYLVPTADGQSMTMISVPSNQHGLETQQSPSSNLPSSSPFTTSNTVIGDHASASHPGLYLHHQSIPNYLGATLGDPLLGSTHTDHRDEQEDLNASSSTRPSSTRTPRTTSRPAVPHCSACGAFGKQLGRPGSRVRPDYCLCANCEDRIKRFKKDGFRKGLSMRC
jgi:hypothetical protein